MAVTRIMGWRYGTPILYIALPQTRIESDSARRNGGPKCARGPPNPGYSASTFQEHNFWSAPELLECICTLNFPRPLNTPFKCGGAILLKFKGSWEVKMCRSVKSSAWIPGLEEAREHLKRAWKETKFYGSDVRAMLSAYGKARGGKVRSNGIWRNRRSMQLAQVTRLWQWKFENLKECRSRHFKNVTINCQNTDKKVFSLPSQHSIWYLVANTAKNVTKEVCKHRFSSSRRQYFKLMCICGSNGADA